MEEIAISKFKATCASVLDRVRKTGKAVRVTRFGKPVAEVVPHRASRKPERWVGSLAGTVKSQATSFLLRAKKTIGKSCADELPLDI